MTPDQQPEQPAIAGVPTSDIASGIEGWLNWLAAALSDWSGPLTAIKDTVLALLEEFQPVLDLIFKFMALAE